MRTKDKNQPGSFQRQGVRIDRCLARVYACTDSIRQKYNRTNAKYCKFIRQSKILQILPPSLVVLTLFLMVIPIYVTQIAHNDVLIYNPENSNEAIPQTLFEGEISQKIPTGDVSQKLSSISVMIGTHARANHAEYEFSIDKNHEAIYSQLFDAVDFQDNRYHTFNFRPIILEDGAEYTFTLRALKTSSDHAIAVYRNRLDGTLIYQASGQSQFYMPVIFVSIFFLTCFFIINFLLNSGKITTEFHFLAAMSVFILPLFFIYPINTVPDEFYHFASAVRLAEYDWSESLAYNVSARHVIQLPENSDQCVGVYHVPPRWDQITSCFASSPDAIMDRFQALFKTRAIIIYTPAALGVMLGDLLSDSPAVIYYCGRIMNLLVVCGIIIYALSLVKKHRSILLAVIMIPMFLQQAASYSYDGILNALCILVIAYAIRFLTTDVKIRKRDFIIIALALLLIGLVKIPYIIVVTPLLFVKREKFGRSRVTKWIFLGGVLLGAMAIYAFDGYLSTAGAETLVVDINQRGLPFSTLFAHPRASIKMLLTTILTQSWGYLVGLIGFFGWFFFSLNPLLVITYVVFLAVVVLSEQISISRSARFLSLFASFAAISGIFLAMYLSYTTAGAPIIEGVQGRYFLPILPLLMFSLLPQKSQITLPKTTSYAFLNLIMFCFIITLLVGFY